LPGFFYPAAEEGAYGFPKRLLSFIMRMTERRTMNIYVGNLSWEMSEDELREAFAPFGQVESARIITDKISGRSRGFGFVEMPDEEEAKAAIAALNNKDLSGRNIKVNEARPRNDDRGGRGGRGGGGFGNRW
jgi:RNA recognition motif-containing protein